MPQENSYCMSHLLYKCMNRDNILSLFIHRCPADQDGVSKYMAVDEGDSYNKTKKPLYNFQEHQTTQRLN